MEKPRKSEVLIFANFQGSSSFEVKFKLETPKSLVKPGRSRCLHVNLEGARWGCLGRGSDGELRRRARPAARGVVVTVSLRAGCLRRELRRSLCSPSFSSLFALSLAPRGSPHSTASWTRGPGSGPQPPGPDSSRVSGSLSSARWKETANDGGGHFLISRWPTRETPGTRVLGRRRFPTVVSPIGRKLRWAWPHLKTRPRGGEERARFLHSN